jgi:hypothetical protein
MLRVAEPRYDNRALPRLEVKPGITYSDAAVSGMVRGQERAGYAAVLERLVSGDVLVVVRLDRLGRSVVDVLQQVEALRERGVVVRALAEGVDSSTPAGRMVLSERLLCALRGARGAHVTSVQHAIHVLALTNGAEPHGQAGRTHHRASKAARRKARDVGLVHAAARD